MSAPIIRKDGIAAYGLELPGPLRDLAVDLANTPDIEFLEAFCRRACALLDAEHFVVGRMNAYSNIMRTICFVSRGELVENVVYGLADTPCAQVMANHTCVYPQGVADEFPRDRMLHDMNIQGYIGAPMVSSDGKPLGIIAGLSEKPIKDIKLAQCVVEYFRRRVAAQLEAAETLERYSMAYSGEEEGFWDWDLKTGAMVVSDSVGKMLGLTPKKRPRDLSALEDLIHAEDRESFIAAIRDHAKSGDQFSLIIRFRSADNEYCWVRASGRGVVDNAGRACRMIGSLINVDKWVKDGALSTSVLSGKTGARLSPAPVHHPHSAAG